MYIDTRDLKEQRDDLKQEILESFLETFEHYAEQTETFEGILFDEEEIESWKEYWQEELDEIADIDRIEEEVCNGEFDSGTTLISEYDFQDYCEEFVRDCGYLSRDTPPLIDNNIDWSGIAEDMRQDYTEVEFRRTTYLFR